MRLAYGGRYSSFIFSNVIAASVGSAVVTRRYSVREVDS